MNKTNFYNVTFISCWDDDVELKNKAIFNPEDCSIDIVFNNECDFDIHILKREFIKFGNGVELDVIGNEQGTYHLAKPLNHINISQ